MQSSDPRPGAQAAALPLAALRGDAGGLVGGERLARRRSSAERFPRSGARCRDRKGKFFVFFCKRELRSLPAPGSIAFLKRFLFFSFYYCNFFLLQRESLDSYFPAREFSPGAKATGIDPGDGDRPISGSAAQPLAPRFAPQTCAQLRGRRLFSGVGKRKGRPGAMKPGSAGSDLRRGAV